MITQLQSLRGSSAPVVVTPWGGSDETCTLGAHQTVTLVAEKVVIGGVTYNSSGNEMEILTLSDAGAFIHSADRPGTINGTMLGIWALVILFVLFKSRIDPL